jgi:outer membrane murein-binding lipoprotein Lpp
VHPIILYHLHGISTATLPQLCKRLRSHRAGTGSTGPEYSNIVSRLSEPRVLLGVAAVSLIVALGAAGIAASMAVAPHFWFPGAFAERGEQGPIGPRGRQGPQGPEGPVGPDAEDAIASVSSDVDDVASSVDDLSLRLDDLEIGAGDQAAASVDDLSPSVDDVSSSVDDLDARVTDLEGRVDSLCLEVTSAIC